MLKLNRRRFIQHASNDKLNLATHYLDFKYWSKHKNSDKRNVWAGKSRRVIRLLCAFLPVPQTAIKMAISVYAWTNQKLKEIPYRNCFYFCLTKECCLSTIGWVRAECWEWESVSRDVVEHVCGLSEQVNQLTRHEVSVRVSMRAKIVFWERKEKKQSMKSSCKFGPKICC